MTHPGVITLLTDFGLEDPYVAIMKGVILSINPDARIVDMGHHIEPGAISQAAWILRESFPHFPKGTVHVGVVDPGVGGNRRPIGIEMAGSFFVGPDNGLFWPIIESCASVKIIHLSENIFFLPDMSHTFHGRDIFAPVAAHLSNGTHLQKMGDAIDDPVRLSFPAPFQEEHLLKGEVMRSDHFGNLITNISRNDLDRFLDLKKPLIQIGRWEIHGIQRRYGERQKGEALALIGSSGYLEISVNLGRACDQLGLTRGPVNGTEVRVTKI